MQSSYVLISNLQLGLSTLLILVNLALSFALKLNLGKQLWIASVRMVVQLLLVGYILEWVFSLQNPIWVIALALLMTGLASQSSVARTNRRFPQIYLNSFIAILAGSFLLTSLVVGGIIQVSPWYSPQYLIPLLGMILGNSLTGVSLALDRFMTDLVDQRDRVETLLALGATGWEAAHGLINTALRVGMIPTINSMMVMGIVSLPGMMTGQILAGASPQDAVRYQIIIVFAIAAGTAISTLCIILLAFRILFNQQDQLQLDRLRKVSS
ncbi:ABC transporter permease [Synechococcus elongatus]|uniref:Iron export ABC transporter permease subunit FetB n=1 Tax=Synechococcus elongatus PCC 11802 TaxID=2283154 RepID=A0AAT9K0I6_SYNEL|nr:iron export ABC transporter permease subunit FetB [Synechococcus elongatus]QFZ92980.1 iron export ABC transporter permease subunit FetB [Synechococcus elongatus PCC 11802]